jgi:predicted dehydrogenase
MTELRFGVIGLGLMGREFASASARWFHLLDTGVRPVITAVCDVNEGTHAWFTDHLASVKLATTDYKALIARDDVDAVYCAVPHHLHERLYCDIIEAGKHLLGEKPFGIDLEANRRIIEIIAEHPELTVRCSSEFPFFPAALRIVEAIRAESFGRIIEVEAGFLHSSDLDPDKPINWKRMTQYNGEYGCMGDLGMHVLHIPLRFGWKPKNVHAQLSNIVAQRPNGKGNAVPCETWDNATLAGDVAMPDYSFPILLHTKRIAPGEMNTWFLRVVGTKRSMAFSTKHPKTLRVLDYEPGGAQVWGHLDIGYASAYKTITGGIFEFGLSDALLQMFAAFCDEVAHGREGMRQPFYCVTPQETTESHEVFTAALESEKARA